MTLEFSQIIPIFIVGFFLGIALCYAEKERKISDLSFFLNPFAIFCFLKEGEELQKRINNSHHAVIVTAYTSRTKFSNYAYGVDILINSFRAKGINYYIYLCKEPIEVKIIIENPSVTHLWIFGHGIRHGLSFKDDLLFYCDVNNELSPKKFIGQYHCNHGGGKSLGDYNHPELEDITQNQRKMLDTRESIIKSLNIMEIPPISLSKIEMILSLLKKN